MTSKPPVTGTRLVAGTDCGERQQAGIINLDDG
jgi:hypothetical protein